MIEFDGIKLLDTTETARRLGIPREALANLRVRGTGPRFRKIGTRVFYTPESIRAYLDQPDVTSTSALEAR